MSAQGAKLAVLEPLSGTASPAIEPATEFPCTLAQQRTWKQDRQRPGDPSLNIGGRIRLEGRVNADLLEQALQALVVRHEPLRTIFVERDGVVVQRVLPDAKLRLRLADLSDVPEAERPDEIARVAREAARRPFDLSQPPLLRTTLVKCDAITSELLLTTHYMVGDCWSNGVLAREMATIYDALREGKVPSLPPLPMQFGDYALWQKAWLGEGGSAQSHAYWTRRLANPPILHVPTDRPLPAVPAKDGNIIGIPVLRSLADAAQEMARANGATFFTLGVAALATLLHRWTGATDVTFGTQVIGRDDVELEGLVGPFVNTVVLRTDLSGDPQFGALLNQVRGTVGEALEHAAAPIENVMEALHATDDEGGRRNSMTAVNFIIQRDFTFDSEHGEFALKGLPSFSPGSKFDLNLFLVERPSGWRSSCEYDPDLFDKTTIERIIRCLLAVIEAVSANPSLRLSAIPVPELALLPQRSQAPRLSAPKATEVPAPVSAATSITVADPDMVRLAAIWSQVLNHKQVLPTDNFFALGGDSMRAARLLARTKATLGQSISLGQLFMAPTLGAMAALLRGNQDQAPNGVVAIQPEGSRPPIFAINNTGIFYTLSRHLGMDQPFIAVQALDPDASPHIHPQDFYAVAARYVETIRRVRPHGPYALMGLCAAGKVAFEVAQQLLSAGEEVRLLAVVDTWAPGHWDRLPVQRRLAGLSALRSARLRRQFQRIREGTLSPLGFLAGRAPVRRFRNSLFQLARRLGLRDTVPAEVQNNLFVEYLDRVAAGYEAQRYPGQVLVFHGPEQPTGHLLDASFGWRELVSGQVDVMAVPADTKTKFVDHHQGLFQDPGAKIMADAIAGALR
jgi:thioesterase domain-containing protein/aryl carrier-like protein